MQRVKAGKVGLEYEIVGSGDPVLLIGPLLADGFLPLLFQPALAGDYRLIRYHRRGWAGSTHTPPPVTIADHASDAAALLEALGISRAHVAGHSSGAAVAVQFALDYPERLHSLALLELSLFSLPAGQAFLECRRARLRGLRERRPRASAGDLPECGERPRLARVPGAPRGAGPRRRRERARRRRHLLRSRAAGDSPSGGSTGEQAAAIDQPVLSLTGAETEPLWNEIADFLRSSLPRVEHCRIEGVGHLLHIQRPEPVARELAQFLARHPIAGEQPVEALRAG